MQCSIVKLLLIHITIIRIQFEKTNKKISIVCQHLAWTILTICFISCIISSRYVAALYECVSTDSLNMKLYNPISIYHYLIITVYWCNYWIRLWGYAYKPINFLLILTINNIITLTGSSLWILESCGTDFFVSRTRLSRLEKIYSIPNPAYLSLWIFSVIPIPNVPNRKF